MSIELTNENPWRPADWRWQRATLLADGELKRNRQFDDRHIQRIEKFVRAVKHDDSADASERLALREPAMFWAYKLNQDPDPARRAEVEARLIANQTTKQIAQRTNTPERTIVAYELAFYDIRDKLQPDSSYVLHTLIGSALHRGIQERDYPLVWKYLAWSFGVHVFEAYMRQTIQPSKPRDPSGVKACLADAGQNALLRKQLIAASSTPVNSFTSVQILEVYGKFLEMDRAHGLNAGLGQSTIINNVHQVLALLPLDIGTYVKPQVDSPALATYDSSSEELSTPRLIAAARGKLSDDDGPMNLKYPEPINHARTDNGNRTGGDAGAGSGH